MSDTTKTDIAVQCLQNDLVALRVEFDRERDAWVDERQERGAEARDLENRLALLERENEALRDALAVTRELLEARSAETLAMIEVANAQLPRLEELNEANLDALGQLGERFEDLKELTQGNLSEAEIRLEGHSRAIEQLQGDLIEAREGLAKRLDLTTDQAEMTLADAQQALVDHRDLTQQVYERMDVEQQVRREALDAMGATARGVRDRVDELDAATKLAFEQQEERWLFNAEQLRSLEAQFLGVHQALDIHQESLDRVETDAGQKLEELQGSLAVENEGILSTLGNLEAAIEATQSALGGQASRLSKLSERDTAEESARQLETERLETEIRNLDEQVSQLGALRESWQGDLESRQATLQAAMRQEIEGLGALVSQLAHQAQFMAQALDSVQKAAIDSETHATAWVAEQLVGIRQSQEALARRVDETLGATKVDFEVQAARLLSTQRQEAQELRQAVLALRDSHLGLTNRVNGILQALLKGARPDSPAPEPN